jgi:S1-C subfamily serine protease
MNNLSNVYQQIKPAIVAIISRVSRNPYFPEIIGTGFIVREDGIVLTNKHIVDLFKTLPRRKGTPKHEWPALIKLFHFIPEKGMTLIDVNIEGVVSPTDFIKPPVYYGPDLPDVAAIHINTKGLPTINLQPTLAVSEGEDIAVAGFPMGTRTLQAPGWIHQISPTLQTGIVSAVLPFPCDDPHALLLDLMTQGGSSGSPVFKPETGEVLGMVYAGLHETRSLSSPKNRDGLLAYKNPTTLTLAIPTNYIRSLVDKLDQIPQIKNRDLSKLESLDEIIKTRRIEVLEPRGKSKLMRITEIEHKK